MAKLYFRYGAMNSGKTTALLQVAHNYEERGMNVVIIKSITDTKAEDNISSRLGIKRKVDILLNDDDKVIDKLNTENLPSAVIVDEAQFLNPKQIDELYYITKIYDIPILCYGLRCDFQMKGFPGSTRLLEIADSIEELKTICRCGSKATQNMRFMGDKPIFSGGQVLIDNSSDIRYESVCGKCYIKYKKSSDR